jgi:1-phosphofructokinase family hexose kinase
MLACISVNPAIDKRVRMAKLTPGEVHRVDSVRAAAGGKAAHVAMVLRTLGAQPLWIGFAGGAGGQELLTGLLARGVQAVPVAMENATRCNLEIVDDDGTVTEILEPGAQVSMEEWRAFEAAYAALFRPGGVTAILSGSLPPGVPHECYADLIEKAHDLGGTAFLDASGDALKLALAAGPDFVKSNRSEAEWLTGSSIKNLETAVQATAKLITAGAKSAAISLGQDGLVWKPSKNGSFYHAQAPKVPCRSAVGSGDATIAGFAYAAQKGLGVFDSLKLAAACGAANCLAELPGQLHAGEVQRLERLVKIEAIS